MHIFAFILSKLQKMTSEQFNENVTIDLLICIVDTMAPEKLTSRPRYHLSLIKFKLRLKLIDLPFFTNTVIFFFLSIHLKFYFTQIYL